MKKAIVTGANGFVGSAVCRELTNQGVEVIAVLRSTDSDTSGPAWPNGIRTVYCDLEGISRLPEIVKDRDIDAFYHFAWAGSAGPLRGDYAVQINNVRYTCDAVRACEGLGCGRFIFAASIMEYEILSTMESNAAPGINTVYSSAKLSADYIARTVAANSGIDYIRAVISNIYGPGERSPRLINSSIRKMLRGEHCAFSSGLQMYDFIYIDDAAKAFFAIGEKGLPNKAYYIGSQRPRPLKDFLLEMRDAINPDIEIGLGELPFDGKSLSYREFDTKAVEKDTGFVPQIGFREGIIYTSKWIKEND